MLFKRILNLIKIKHNTVYVDPGTKDDENNNPFCGMAVINKNGDNSWRKSWKMCHVPKEQGDVLKTAIKLAWNSASFCPNESAQDKLVAMVLELTGYACFRESAKDRDQRIKQFTEQWGDAILDGLNEHRQ